MQEKLKPRSDIISSMFFSACIAMIFTAAAGVVAHTVDGIIASRFLGTNTYSAISLLGPFSSALTMLAGFISTGCQVVTSRLIGTGKKEESDSVFSISVVALIGLSVLVLLASMAFPRQLFSICGISMTKHAEIYPEMLGYLHGYMFGIPALMTIQLLGPMVVMDGGQNLFSLSAIVLCVSNILGDLLNVLVIKGGSFGMGMVTSISYLLQLLLVSSHFFTGNGTLRFSLRSVQVHHLAEMARAGSPSFVRKLATVLRDLLINRMNLAIALTTAAIAARGVQNDLNSLLFCISTGVGKALLTMTGIYYGANDRKGLKRLFITSLKTGIKLAGIAGLISYIFARVVAHFYMDDPEAIDLATFAIRCMALGLVLDTILIGFQNYLQGIGNHGIVNFLGFGERFFIPVLVAFVMGRFFGTKGIMASIAVSKLLLAIMLFILICIHCRRFPRDTEDFMFLPKDFGGNEEDSRDVHLYSMEDVMQERDEAILFCRKHGLDEKESQLMGLFVEEMAGYIIQNGKPRKPGAICVDYRLFVNNGRICLSLRDYCHKFDPMHYIKRKWKEAPQGLQIVAGLANEIKYFNTFNSNCVLIYLN